jgi:molybdenum cofactor cytidylyltransferase
VSPRIAAIVLAAGSSRRFGSANKLLERVAGEPLVAHAVDALLGASAAPVVVVTGHDADAVQSALGDRAVRFVHNPQYDRGMGCSLAVGARAVADELDGLLIALGDMPAIRAEHARALLNAFDPQRVDAICVPVFEGSRGHPVLFGAGHLAALRTLEGDHGARSILEAHPDAVFEVPVHDVGVLRDVDYPADLSIDGC